MAEFVKSGTSLDHYPDDELPEVAFAGRSNVGKSSLMNSMLGRKKLVKVSSTPGRTQLLNWFRVNDAMMFCDLPGYGFAKVPPSVRRGWGKMIETYLSQRSSLLALVVIVDVRRGFEDDDKVLIESAGRFQLQPILVATKTDKFSKSQLFRRKVEIAREMGASMDGDIIWYSAETGQGRDELWKRIRSLLPDLDVHGGRSGGASKIVIPDDFDADDEDETDEADEPSAAQASPKPEGQDDETP